MKFLASPATLAVSIIAVLISVGSIALSVTVNDHRMSECVTKTHWEESLGHFFRYGDVAGTGEVKLLPTSIQDFYEERLQCVVDSQAFGTRSAYERQLELFSRLQMVESVKDNDGQVCDNSHQWSVGVR